MEDEELKNYKHQWRKADKDGSGTLDYKEVIVLVQKVQYSTGQLNVVGEHDRPEARIRSGR